ncbi:related to K+ homeostasis protein Kha1 [Cephalotrichum gorgonifer]|uniref:Related to K+ homeostasis protein Kha1 n=1 Tax=Cephalotrichum gorgonifer TaxID=2041049 RepID=A0AAE8SZR1_9PEZI|nr:related to K+ homeostasis protein Kha1 [Cephalotrichum gorgonifer]
MSTTTEILSTLTTTAAAAAASTTAAHRAPPQGGVIEGSNPSVYNPKEPIVIFIIQAGLILIVCHILHWPLSKIRQPRVIAEVIGGIILGPSVMGHIPGFRAAIFPAESIPNLNLVANLGLVLYLFLIGLETDVRFLLSNWRVATSVAFGGLAIPFGLGCAIAWGLYNEFRNDDGVSHVAFPVYMLFVGVAIAITAFPVLCRILTELKLLDTPVGVITLAAGVANDVVGWVLLALCVALVNAGSGLSALWILLACVGYMLFLLFAVKPALNWLFKRSGSLENGPSQSMMALILLVALASAFFTAIIGVHAIFGGFMVGLILPRERRFNIIIIEKLEDLISALFLPLYFTLSGLNTDLGLLDTGIAWAYVFAVTFVAFFAKFFSASGAARLNGLVWRESFSIGVLMACKGLVELIVLNIGLNADIISQRTFTIFVVMALITTFLSTPLASFLYPPWYQKKIAAWKRGEIDWETGEPIQSSDGSDGSAADGSRKVAVDNVQRLLVYLRLDNLPAVLGLISLFGNPSWEGSPPAETTKAEESGSANATEAPERAPKRPVRAHGMRLVQLTDRDSSFMTVAQVNEFSSHDPVVNTFCTVGQLHHLAVSGEVAIMPEARFAEALLAKSPNAASDLLLVPWSETGNIGDSQILASSTATDKLTVSYAGFVKSMLQSGEQNIAVFFTKSDDAPSPSAEHQSLERAKLSRAYSFSAAAHELPALPPANRSCHIFLAYLGGGGDDRLALALVLQLCERAEVTATIVKVSAHVDGASDDDEYFNAVLNQVPSEVLARIKTETIAGRSSVEDILTSAAADLDALPRDTGRRDIVVVGRHNGARVEIGKLKPIGEVGDSLGVVGAQIVAGGIKGDLLVIQARQAAN